MYASTKWINDYLDPPATAEEQAELLTQAGFPLEDRQEVDDSDIRQDFEMSSNRGDCVCHVGLAREIAAISGRTLKVPRPSPRATGPQAQKLVTLENRQPKQCPLYTARIIKGARVGPSPEWLASRLRAINQIPRNNIVDASNFVLFELGQPTHVFDLATLAGPQIIVRMALPGERFLPIGESAERITLSQEDLVIADSRRAVAIAGVKGGQETCVTDATTDLLIEAATFDPVMVRRTSRRLAIESDSSFRFERGVSPGQVDAAAQRLAQLILELAGGELAEGVVVDGAAIPPTCRITMRPSRCRRILGVEIPTEKMIEWLDRLEFQPRLKLPGKEVIECRPPVYRLDVEREIDLIEEVGRMMGHDELAVDEVIKVRPAPPQATDLARRAVCNALAGMGFVETVTHSLISRRSAEACLEPGSEVISIKEIGDRTDMVLRPSLLPSLLRVLAHNRANGLRRLSLFETAAIYSRRDQTPSESRQLALVADLENAGDGLRPIRGVIERLVELLRGHGAGVEVVADDTFGWFAPGAVARVDGRVIGRLGLIPPSTGELFELSDPIAGAELALEDLCEGFPPDTQARALPGFPAVERDVSAIVDVGIEWAQVRGVIEAKELEHLEAIEFISSFRGKQIGPGRKSVSIRMRFRAADHTLTNESVDKQVAVVMEALQDELKAHIRR